MALLFTLSTFINYKNNMHIDTGCADIRLAKGRSKTIIATSKIKLFGMDWTLCIFCGR